MRIRIIRIALYVMKKITDPRHLRRIAVVKELFTYSFRPQKLHEETTRQVVEHLNTIDEHIKKYASQWPIDKIGKIDLAILRLSVYELTVTRNEPVKVVIDEAVEIAKEFGNDASPKFINGVLGTVVKWIQKK